MKRPIPPNVAKIITKVTRTGIDSAVLNTPNAANPDTETALNSIPTKEINE